MKKRTVVILAAAALAVIVAAGAGIGKAYAYFTTYTRASGERTIELGDKTTITEDYEAWKKDITITNAEDSKDAVYVRVKAFAGSQFTIDYEGSGWSEDEEGFWVYEDVVLPGKAAPVITVNITGADGETPQIEEGKTVNVIVVYETTPAVENGTDEAGKTLYDPADWSRGLTKTEPAEADPVETDPVPADDAGAGEGGEQQ